MNTEFNAGQGAGESLAPAGYTDGFVEVDRLRLHYLDYGTAGRPPMLCIHGGGANGHWFDFVAPGFVAGYHVRALDQRGHGDSEWAQPPAYSYPRFASDLSEVVEKLNLQDFVLIGHSMGGMIAMVYAATYPGRLSRLVVVDSSVQITEARLADWRGVGERGAHSYKTREEFMSHYRLRPAGTTAGPEIIRHVAQYGGRQFEDGGWRHKFDRDVYAKREFVDGLACWDRIKIPALFVKGGLSDRITPELVAEVQARCPSVEVAEVSNSGHHVPLDNPAGFVHAVTAFLARHPPRQRPR